MNYYELLGVSYYATSSEIKEAYRKKVKETHPDNNKGDSELFKLIIEAYEVLANDEKRKRYDDILFKITKFNVMVAVPKKEKVSILHKKEKKEKKEKKPNVLWKVSSLVFLFATLILIGVVIYINNQNQNTIKDNSILNYSLTSTIKENQDLRNDYILLDDQLTSIAKENEDLSIANSLLDSRITSMIKENEDLSEKVDSIQSENMQQDYNNSTVATFTQSVNPVQKSKLDYVTLGSTEDEVRAILGTPNKIQFSTWYYNDNSSISFNYFDKTVDGWNNESGTLKVK